MLLYNLLKNLIVNKRFTVENMTNKLNVFYSFDQITEEQYSELLGMINGTNTTMQAVAQS